MVIAVSSVKVVASGGLVGVDSICVILLVGVNSIGWVIFSSIVVVIFSSVTVIVVIVEGIIDGVSTEVISKTFVSRDGVITGGVDSVSLVVAVGVDSTAQHSFSHCSLV